jgi:laccase
MVKLTINHKLTQNLNVVESTYRWMVDHGKTYLLRVVNAVVAADLFFAISQHNLTVVGMDGHYTKPLSTSYISISPGQTMDILVTTNQSLGHYYMAARQFWSQSIQISDFNQFNTTAILQYKGNYTNSSSPSFPNTLPLYKDIQAALKFTTRLRSLASEEHPVNVPLNITTRMSITLSMNDFICKNTTCIAKEGENILAASVNNISWANPNIDILLAYYRFFLFASFIFNKHCFIIYLMRNKVCIFCAFSFFPVITKILNDILVCTLLVNEIKP